MPFFSKKKSMDPAKEKSGMPPQVNPGIPNQGVPAPQMATAPGYQQPYGAPPPYSAAAAPPPAQGFPMQPYPGQYAPQMQPGAPPPQQAYYQPAPMQAPPQAPQGYPTQQQHMTYVYNQQQGVAQGQYDAGARFDGTSQQRIPPPPPGCLPNQAQMAAASGQNVVMSTKKASFW